MKAGSAACGVTYDIGSGTTVAGSLSVAAASIGVNPSIA